jgi:membrane-associated phospholipid phosphatase
MCAVLTAAAAQNSAGIGEGGCGQIASQLPHTESTFVHGIEVAPRSAIRLRNLRWELPIVAATGLLIATSDRHINSHIQSPSFVSASTLGSNVGLGIEFGTAGMMYFVGCPGARAPFAANTGWVALEAMGAASLVSYGIKLATNRQYAYAPYTHGEFWEGGKSFPSGHAAASFAFASVIAHRYPRNHWLKWSVYGLATGVSLARVGGKKHFASDILVGGTLGYVTGTYLASH